MSKKEKADIAKQLKDERDARTISIVVLLSYLALVIICYLYR